MTTGAQAARGRTTTTGDRDRRRTPAQWYCLLAGLSLLLAGIVGFIVDSSFTTGDGIDGGKLLSIFEVNGIHNLIHIASGLVLLAASPKPASAQPVAIAFGLVFAVATISGLIAGTDVLGLTPANRSQNILDVPLTAPALMPGS